MFHSEQAPWHRLDELYFRIKKAAAWVIEKITGSLPLTITNAVEHAIQKLTRYGLCTQPSGTWNTAITQEGKCIQDGTPTPAAPANIVTNNGAIKYSVNMANVNEQTARVGYYINAQGSVLSDIYNWFYQDFIPVKPNTAYTLSMSSPVYYVSISEYSTAEDSGFVVRKTGSTGSNTSLTITTGANTNFVRFGTNVNRVVVSMEMVLAINWMLNEGSTAIPYAPYVEGGIYTDGTPEVLTVGGANLFDTSSYTEINAYVNANTGVLTAGSPGSMTQYCAVIPCKPNAQYNITGQGTSAWGAFPSDSIGTTATAFTKGGILTTGANDRYLIGLVRANGDSIDYRNTLVVQEAQAVSVPMLLSAGGYKDTAEFIQGVKTGKVGIKVFDGTETFTVSSSGAMITVISDAAVGAENTPMNTHFALESSATSIAVGKQRFGSNGSQIYSTNYYMKHTSITAVADFKSWLASEYANGTPVIVLYPLATVTTEQISNKITYRNTDAQISYTAEVSDITITTTQSEKSTPTPNTPLDIVCNNGKLVWNGTAVVADGTPEVLTVRGANLANMVAENIDVGKIIYDNGSVSNSAVNFVYNKYIPVEAGQNYVLYGRRKSDNAISAYNRICWYTANKGWISRATYTKDTIGSAVAPNNAAYARFTVAPVDNSNTLTLDDVLDFNWMFAEASAEIPYQPHITPQTVSVPMLLSVGNYKDEQNLINGLLTHKIGIMVFDGTEAWRASSSANIYILDSAIATNLTAICTHFQKVSNTTSAANMPDGSFKGHSSNTVLYFKDESVGGVNGFKANLAAQYAAGTPVIILYRLAEETTESVTPQPLNTTEGTNIIDSTSNVSPIDVEVEYAAKRV